MELQDGMMMDDLFSDYCQCVMMMLTRCIAPLYWFILTFFLQSSAASYPPKKTDDENVTWKDVEDAVRQTHHEQWANPVDDDRSEWSEWLKDFGTLEFALDQPNVAGDEKGKAEQRPRVHRVLSDLFSSQAGSKRSVSPILTPKASTERPKSFVCAECDRTFKRQGLLDRHQRVHSGERPFKCPHCGVRSTRADNLKNHILFVHGM